MGIGQFFTPEWLVDLCISLKKNNGNLLEPSFGDGAFHKLVGNSIFIEIDKSVIKHDDVLNMNFFDYSIENKFDTIIGNPPYFKTKGETDLYLQFIEKCFYHLKDKGEIIFIVPRGFIKLTSAKKVNELLFNNGTITHFIDFGDKQIFKKATPNVCVFRFEKDNFSHKTIIDGKEYDFNINNGIISFTDKKDKTIGDIFDIKVGAVSGSDKLFENDNGVDFVYSKTRTDGSLKKMICSYDDCLLQFKEKLLNRKIRKFDETNWWKWGRNVNFNEDKERIYVNCKTRRNNPFFYNKCKKWDGSILALFPKEDLNIEEWIEKLNNQNWKELGFKVGGRFIFSQKSLINCYI
jgi:adenine-specific DNA-methyltransferase